MRYKIEELFVTRYKLYERSVLYLLCGIALYAHQHQHHNPVLNAAHACSNTQTIQIRYLYKIIIYAHIT